MRNTPVIILLVTSIAALFGLGGLRAARAGMEAPLGDSVTTVLRSSEDGLHFILDVPRLDIDANGAVTAAGLQMLHTAPGAPALPSYVTFVALPPAASASVDVSSAGQNTRQTIQRVMPVTTTSTSSSAEDTESLLALAATPELVEAAEIYSRDALYPGVRFRLSEPMYFRDLRVVRLELFPVQYNPVQGILEHVSQLEVTISFAGTDSGPLAPISGASSYLQSIAPLVLNFEQGLQWRSLPDASSPSAGMSFPIDRDTFKIAVTEDGIYELTYSALATAGMNVGEVNPDRFEMMYRGQPVAYEFVNDDGDDEFDQNEKIRFYGWAFDGSRLERQFLTENVFWLWADGNALRISDEHDDETNNPLAASFRESITREPDIAFTHVWTDNWDDAPNEPDAWVWERVQKTVDDWPVKESIQEITLPAPASSGANALVTVEILSRENRSDHDVSIFLNGDDAESGHLQWTGARSVNVTMTLPANQLLEGTNEVHIAYNTPVTTSNGANSTPALYYMNRITVDYDRHFVADGEQLQFHDANGNSTYQISGFSGDNAIVWELSDRLNPTLVTPDVTGSNPFTYEFGTSEVSSIFFATHAGNVRQPLSITKYVGPDLDPSQGASWLGISHAAFMNEAQTLATHRMQPENGGHSTHIVNIRDVINQYGYGLPLPGAIRQFLQHALVNWPVAPQYLLLFGDGHINPRQIPCNAGNTQCSHWTTEPNYVLTDMVYTDQFVGLNASDYSFSLLVGDDLLPDLAVGRLAVQTPAEAQNMVDKIIQYEGARWAGGAWQRNVVFLADDPDTAGQFCEESEDVTTVLPPDYSSQVICLPSNAEDDIDETRIELYDALNNPPADGATFLNYRGHGAVRSWAGNLINLDHPTDHWTPWFNNEPLIILSMDCLDGHFAQPGYEALSEVFLDWQYHGSVAHWSSSGYGYDFQHRPLHRSFYEGLFEQDLTAIGDAVNYAKLDYALLSMHPSQLYSFILQGDPAMRMIPFRFFLPAFNG